MSIIEIILSLSGGLLFLYLGAEGLVRGSSSLARGIGISPLVIGLTIVALGTSSPELVVSVKASLNGNGAIALGNVIGSNIANIALILALTSLIRPVFVTKQIIKKEIPIMNVTAFFMVVLIIIDKSIDRFDGILLLTGIVLYIYYNYYTSKKEKDKIVLEDFNKEIPKEVGKPFVSFLLAAAGLGVLIFGANIFVDGAVQIATKAGLSEAIIGLTIVSVGTSLPELVTSIVAAVKKESDIAIGNVIGSNIFNVLAILGAAAVVNPISATQISFVDLGVMILTGIIIWPLTRTGYKLDRWEGALLLAGFIGYYIYLLN